MNKVLIALTLVLVLAGLVFSMQRVNAQGGGPYTAYMSGPMQLVVSTTAGQVLASLDIPAGSEVSISAPDASDAAGAPWDAKSLPSKFTGDVSIRTRLKSELVAGSLRPQMLTAPFRLDIQDAVVLVSRTQ